MTELDPARCPIVYLGPSLSAEEARPLLPNAIFKRPVRRNDLYLAREYGAHVIVVIDGVFMQDAAISPREVVEVARDGALVFGASSMGALRASECWPVGVRGVGLVYRLFRAGVIDSDDEVAVTIDAADGFRAASVALVNVRYAVHCAIRERILDRATGARLFDAAKALFYAHRRWPTIVRQAGVTLDDRQRAFLRDRDLKRADALAAITMVARLGPEIYEQHARTSTGPVARANEQRERFYDPLFGRNLEDVRRELFRWMVGSGRAARHGVSLLAAQGDREPPPRSAAQRPIELRRAATRAMNRWMDDERVLGDALWHELAAAGELDAELMRMRAVIDAATAARAAGLKVRASDRHIAEQEIAFARGSNHWDELEPWPFATEVRDELALAKRARDGLLWR